MSFSNFRYTPQSAKSVLEYAWSRTKNKLQFTLIKEPKTLSLIEIDKCARKSKLSKEYRSIILQRFTTCVCGHLIRSFGFKEDVNEKLGMVLTYADKAGRVAHDAARRLEEEPLYILTIGFNKLLNNASKNLTTSMDILDDYLTQ